MTIGIYCIEHIDTGRKYVGKSIRIEKRLSWHKYYLQRKLPTKDVNRNLWNAVQKYGWDRFKTYILESFEHIDEDVIGSAELRWMDELKSCDRRFGYNLRRDTSTKMITHPETRIALSKAQKLRYSDPDFGDYERELSGDKSRNAWANMCPIKKSEIGDSISKRLQKYNYAQCDLKGNILVIWRSVKEIKTHYTDIHIPNIHSVADGHKATYLGFIWEKVDPSQIDTSLLYDGDAPEIQWTGRVNPPQWLVRCIDPIIGQIEVFDSIAEAADAHGVSYSYMSNCVNGRIENIHGYAFEKMMPEYVYLQKLRKATKHLIFEKDDLGC